MRRLAAMATVLAFIATAFLLGRGGATAPEKMAAGKFPEQIVYVRSQDDIVSGGAVFTAPKDSARPIAIIWIHGWGVNFYQPTYVAIGRALAEGGYTCIAGNTRMHDLGNVAGWKGNKRIRGGGYWGVAGEEVRDLAAWVDFAEARGFRKVVLVGHSAGAAAVRTYQAEKQDPRVVGLVLASGSIAANGPTDADQLAEATRLMAKGEGDALVRDPKRSFPSYISAATLLDIASTPPESKDFFGIQPTATNPAVTRIRCPLLAFFGTRADVGSEKDLELLKSSLKRLSTGPSRVDTAMIEDADHMYAGQEKKVADTIAKWADTLIKSDVGKGHTAEKR
ncbi:MAG TPA: alpha/beta fold hydrolase [Candidatus Limnocylindrales bacterium]|jgi:pimeloyl-ACP methyl ester carboxylesterase|nr:alpha/beta fold hydrolase [Candidatus Limnocylindrales bacterium]